MRIAPVFAATAPGSCKLAAADDGAQAPDKLVGLAFPIGVASQPSADGFRYQFDGPPSNLDELVDVVVEHDDDAVAGRLAEPFAITEAGAAARARLFNTSRGRDLLVEAEEGVRTGFSISASFPDFAEDEEGVRHVAAETWRVEHLGVVRRPAFTEASGLTIAASAAPIETGDNAMTDAPNTVVELPTTAELAAAVAEHLRDAARSTEGSLARFSSRAAFVAEFLGSDETGRQQLAAEFAVVDQITTNNPGVIVPGWRTEIKANLDRRRPAVTAMGGPLGLPDDGMDVSWPYFDGSLDDIIAEQAAEKTELSSVRIDIKKDTEAIKTAGVVSDISYQLLMRSTPSYLAAYQSITEAAWARYTERVFELALLAGGTAGSALPLAFDAAGVKALKAALFAESMAVEDVTGAPANVVLAATDVFGELGAGDLPTPDGQSSTGAAGNASASTLRINVDGLEIVRAPFLTAGKVIVTNDLAAKFAESGPMLATEENVKQLGRDVATWGMYVPAEIYFPAGVRVLTQA